MARLSLREVSREFRGRPVVNNVSFDIADGELAVVLGASGCGKTTILRMIAGLTEPTSGRIFIGEDDVTRRPPRLRNIGMVFQNYALFPNMTVGRNIGFGLKQKGTPPAAIAKRVAELTELMQLRGREDEFVQTLSGGQQQRVALARALAATPKLLLMDEPLSALDAKLREATRDEIRRIQQELKITTILVTHDQHEAMILADRIILMGDGAVRQMGSPAELYTRPADVFVADFLGRNNRLRGVVIRQADGVVFVRLENEVMVRARSPHHHPTGALIEVAVRPEAIDFGPDNATDQGGVLDCVVEERRFLGNVTHYILRTAWNQLLLAELKGSTQHALAGDRVQAFWRLSNAIIFPAAS